MAFIKGFLGASTAETEDNVSLMGASGALLSTVVAYFCGAYASLWLDATTPSFETASMNPGIDTVNSVVEGSYVSTGAVSGEEAAAWAIASPTIVTTGAGAIGTTIEPDPIMAIIIRRKDAMPYSCIEKRAEKVFSFFYKNDSKAEQFPTIIAHNQETYDAFLPIYGNSIDSLKENLDAMETALKNESGK